MVLCNDTLALPHLESFEFDLHLKTFGPLGLTSKLSGGLSLHSGSVLEGHGKTSGVGHCVNICFFAFYSVTVQPRGFSFPSSFQSCPALFRVPSIRPLGENPVGFVN